MKSGKILVISILLLALFIPVSLYSYSTIIQFRKRSEAFTELEKTIKRELWGSGFRCAVYIEDLKFPGLNIALRENERFPAASMIKLPILLVVLDMVKNKVISLNDTVIITAKDIDGGSGKLKLMKLPLRTNIRGLIELMISVSDNSATNKLIEIIGFSRINKGFQKLGFKHTILTRYMVDFSSRRRGFENYTSARDIAYAFKKIYDTKLLGRELSGLALYFLEKQKIRDRLPRYLPKGTLIAHKTGLERNVVHDAGIVFAPKGRYLICMLVNGKQDYRNAKKIIARTSLLTYNLYQ